MVFPPIADNDRVRADCIAVGGGDTGRGLALYPLRAGELSSSSSSISWVGRSALIWRGSSGVGGMNSAGFDGDFKEALDKDLFPLSDLSLIDYKDVCK